MLSSTPANPAVTSNLSCHRNGNSSRVLYGAGDLAEVRVAGRPRPRSSVEEDKTPAEPGKEGSHYSLFTSSGLAFAARLVGRFSPSPAAKTRDWHKKAHLVETI